MASRSAGESPFQRAANRDGAKMGFQAAAAAAAAQRAIGRDARMADFAGGAVAAGKQLAAFDDTAADAFQQRHEQHMLRTAASAVGYLAERLPTVASFNHGGQIRRAAQMLDDRNVGPAGNVHGADRTTRGDVDRSRIGGADADEVDADFRRHRNGLLQVSGDRSQLAGRVAAFGGVPAALPVDGSRQIDQRRGDVLLIVADARDREAAEVEFQQRPRPAAAAADRGGDHAFANDAFVEQAAADVGKPR